MCFVNWLSGLLPVEHSGPPRNDMVAEAGEEGVEKIPVPIMRPTLGVG